MSFSLSALVGRLTVLALLALPLTACDDLEQLNAPRPQPVRQVVVPPPPPPPVAAAPITATDLAALPDPATEPAPPPAPGGAVVVIPSQPVAAGTAATPTPAAPAAESPLLAQQRASCAREGGRLQSLPGGLVTCIRQTSDSGRACTGSNDCEGACLARSGTCAPITPLRGCHEVLLAPGSRVTQCVD